MRFVGLLTAVMLASAPLRSQTACFATGASLTPAGWHSRVTATTPPPKMGLRLVREIPLPGPANRFDYQIESVGAVDLARYTVGHTGPDELGFGEVIEPVNPLRIAVLHEDHGVRRIFRP